MVGLRNPFETEFRYPFHVVAVKQVQVVVVSAKDFLEVLWSLFEPSSYPGTLILIVLFHEM